MRPIAAYHAKIVVIVELSGALAALWMARLFMLNLLVFRREFCDAEGARPSRGFVHVGIKDRDSEEIVLAADSLNAISVGRHFALVLTGKQRRFSKVFDRTLKSAAIVRCNAWKDLIRAKSIRQN